MEEIILKEELDKIKKIQGEIRGAVLKTDVNFVLAGAGKEGLEKIESEMEKLGYPFNYSEIKSLYPNSKKRQEKEE